MARFIKHISVFGLLGLSSVIASSASGATLPTSGLLLALGADSGVTPTSGTITSWLDEVTNGERLNTIYTRGTPSLSTGVLFPNGTTHNVVAFNGSSGLGLNTTFSLQKLNIFVVADTTQNQTSGEFVTNYHNNSAMDGTASHGWAVGNSDSNSGQLKWFTGPDGSDVLGGTTGLSVTPGQYYSINMSANNAVPRKIASTFTVVGGTPTSASTAAESTYGPANNHLIPYDGSETATLGMLFLHTPTTTAGNYIQFLKGNIAEVLIYDDTSFTTAAQVDAESAAVNSYINEKYFTPEPGSLALIGLGGLLALRRRRA